MREIILDTETTGFDPFSGDRIVEIGCVELINHIVSGERFHTYINPERDMPEAAFRIHGLSSEFLSGHPVFSEVAVGFTDFIGSSPVIAHNAEFDLKFLNWELDQAGLEQVSRSRVIDTLAMARSKFPGAQNSLDALCKRFDISNIHRTLHGALLDAEILAEVYLELMGGRQTGLDLVTASREAGQTVRKKAWPVRSHTPREEELSAHSRLLDQMTDPIWRQ